MLINTEKTVKDFGMADRQTFGLAWGRGALVRPG